MCRSVNGLSGGRLLIFNPDTDYALASGSDFYTPPKRVKTLAAERGDCMLAFAGPSDRLLTNSLAQRLESMTDGSRDLFWQDITRILPWGWNPALRHRLVTLGAPERLLPTRREIAEIRALSHRHTTISFAQAVGDRNIPAELFSEEEAMRFLRDNPGCWFKAPWSSSGRGVINTSADLTETQIREWVHGSLRRQGSVMAEIGEVRKLDFATEWWILPDGTVRFEGYSLFETSRRGKYHSNVVAPQDSLAEIIQSSVDEPLSQVLERQKRAISELISPHYRGPLGIDMFADSLGRVRACVEINLRLTMGHVSLAALPPD